MLGNCHRHSRYGISFTIPLILLLYQYDVMCSVSFVTQFLLKHSNKLDFLVIRVIKYFTNVHNGVQIMLFSPTLSHKFSVTNSGRKIISLTQKERKGGGPQRRQKERVQRHWFRFTELANNILCTNLIILHY